MNKGQRMFMNFVVKRGIPDKEAELRAIVSRFFRIQDAGALTKEKISETEWEIIARLRPECVQEFRQAGRR
jgi:hypothetical protein